MTDVWRTVTGCHTCGGYGNRHDPIAHGWEQESERMTHDEIAEIAFEVIRTCHERGITDPLRLAHAVACGVKLADLTARPQDTDR